MPNTRKPARGDKRTGKAAAAGKRADAPLLGEAALQQALAGFGVSPNWPGGARAARGGSAANGAAAGTAQAHSRPGAKTVAQVLGEIVWLMTQSPRHKAVPLGDLEWLVMPALLLRQFRIFYKGEQPVGVALWALADDLVAKRIDGNDKRLTAVEWKSGARLRIIELVAPFGGEAEMRAQVDAI